MSSSNDQKRSHPHVPKFGEWSNKGGNVPYTAVFDKARKGKLKDGVKILNPNDPEENPEFFTMVEKEKMKGEGMVRIKLPVVNEKNNRQRFSESESVAASRSLRVGCSSRFSSHHRRRSDESELSFCSEKISFECNNSSLILQQRRRQRLKERSEKKKGLESSSRRASTASSGHHRRQSSISITDAGMIPIPKFGEWDENDPKSGEDFTLKFNKVKEEQNNVSEMFSTVLSSGPNRGRITHKKSFFISKICCFHLFARGSA